MLGLAALAADPAWTRVDAGVEVKLTGRHLSQAPKYRVTVSKKRNEEVPMRIVHTADWHLGHVLHDRDREAEHRAFLDWLLVLLEEREVDGGRGSGLLDGLY